MRFTGSKSDLARRCLWWARPDSPRHREPSEDAIDGISSHAEIQRVIHGESARNIGEKAQTFAEFWGTRDPARTATEVTFAYNVKTGKCDVVKIEGPRAYVEHPDVIHATLDAVEMGFAGPNVIYDWKTGHRAPPSASQSGQLMTGAVMLAASRRLTGPIKLVMAHVTEDAVFTTEHEPDALELIEHEQWMRSITSQIETSTPNAGPWCRSEYCESYGLCPATSGAIEVVSNQFVPVENLTHKLSRSASDLTPESARFQYEILKRLKAETAPLWRALHEFVTRHKSLDLGDGFEFSESEVSTRKINLTDDARAMLSIALGASASVAMPPSEPTLKSLHEASKIEAKKAGQTIKSFESTLLSQLEAMGALEVKKTKKIEERKSERTTRSNRGQTRSIAQIAENDDADVDNDNAADR